MTQNLGASLIPASTSTLPVLHSKSITSTSHNTFYLPSYCPPGSGPPAWEPCPRAGLLTFNVTILIVSESSTFHICIIYFQILIL